MLVVGGVGTELCANGHVDDDGDDDGDDTVDDTVDDDADNARASLAFADALRLAGWHGAREA